MTVRQVFYACEVAGLCKKTETGYRDVQRQLAMMRREGILEYDFIADGTRWQRKPSTWRSVEDYVAAMSRSYRRDLWQRQDCRIEIWLEKDALADIVSDITMQCDVSLMVSRGQSSLTFLHSAGIAARNAWLEAPAPDFTTHVYALYDHDAGGERAARTIKRDLPEFAGIAPVTFELLAVTDDQIEDWHLPTRPPKRSDPEAKKWKGRCVELDAIPPDKLRDLVEGAIKQHVDERAWDIERTVEQEERKGFDVWAKLPANGLRS